MPRPPLRIDTLTHDEATRRNAPTAELEAFVPPDVKAPIAVAYARRNPDLDPQLVWRGKDVADWSDLVVEAPPLYIQEKVHPKALIEALKRYRPKDDSGPSGGRTAAQQRGTEGAGSAPEQIDLFADFNGIAPDARTEFYAHDQHWSNRMILGDGLKVMASLAEREGLKGQVQCIYIDPPYGIKFNSNFQWSTTSRDVKDGKADHLTREPEQVKAFRDTWRDGIHSYLTYLRDRLTVARDLLTESGSVFVQIGDENVHRVRALMDEVFGDENFVDQIIFQTSSGRVSDGLDGVYDVIIWYAKSKETAKFRRLKKERTAEQLDTAYTYLQLNDGSYRTMSRAERDGEVSLPEGARRFRPGQTQSQTGGKSSSFVIDFEGQKFQPPKSGGWRTTLLGFERAAKSERLMARGASVAYRLCDADNPSIQMTNIWTDTVFTAFGSDKTYIVQTNPKVIERCILMTTDPGDLVLDPTCGSGTTAYVAEQWGRRWITIDTSRVALALARARIMGARYPWYLLADSREGQVKEGEVTRTVPADTPTYGRLRQGFVYRRVPHITLKSIANNAEIDMIWEKYQPLLEALRMGLLSSIGINCRWEEWNIPRKLTPEQAQKPASGSAFYIGRTIAQYDGKDPREAFRTAGDIHRAWWELRIERQREIDASIAAKADTEYLYDQPYEDKGRVRVAGPFTVESLSPHRTPAVDVDDSLFDELEAAEGRRQPGPVSETADFAEMVLDNLRKSGVQQAHKADRLVFKSLNPWPGRFVCAEGQVCQSSTPDDNPRRAAILVGPEYGTIARADLTAAGREAMEAGFDLLIAAGFNFDAHASEFTRMGPLTVLQARINPDLHMPDLASTGAGNLFTVFGEPDIQVHDEGDGCVSIELAGVDMYKGGQIESSDAADIAVWFVDTDYDYESFFVRHAYFPGANDPYKALKTTLKAEIDEDAWASLKRTRSRPFPRPAGGRVAVKVINHLGDEVMKVVGV